MREQVNPMLLSHLPAKAIQVSVAGCRTNPSRSFDRRQAKGLVRAVLAVLFLAATAVMAPAGLQAQAVSFLGVQTTVPNSDAASGVAVDGVGNLFLVEGGVVGKVPANDGPTTIVAAGLQAIPSVAVDGAGNIFITDGNSVVKVPANGGAQTTVANIGLVEPSGLAVDGAGNIFIADYGKNSVVKLLANGGEIAVPVAGLNHPLGVAVDRTGNVFIADYGNNRVVKVPASGGAQTTVGTGLAAPQGVAVDGAGNVFIADTQNSRVVEVPANGDAQTTVGTGLNLPEGVAVDGAGNVFIADSDNNRVVEVQLNAVKVGNTNVCPSGQSTPAPCNHTIALNYTINQADTINSVNVVTQGASNLDFTLGSTTCTGGQGADSPCTVTVTFAPTAPGLRAGSVQIVDDLGTVLATTPLYGTGQGSQIVFDSNTPATVLTSGLSIPSSVAIDGAGNAYVVDSANSQVLKITPGGTPTPLLTALALPSGVAVDGTGDVFITNTGSGQITKITPAGVQTTISPAGLLSPTGIAADGSGDLFVVDSGNNRAVEIRPSGVQTTLTSELNQAFGIAVDAAGNVFIADTNNNRIVEVPFGKAQVVVPVSGLYLPSDVKVDAAGDLFIADHGNSRVVEWSAAGVQTIVPTNGVSFPIGLALDGAGDLFVTDDVANLAVELPRSQPPAFHFVNTVAGTTSSDSPLSATVENIGNQPLNAIAPGLSISKASGDTVFAQVAGTGTPADCTTAFSLAPGSSCNLSISFTATEDNVYRGSAVLTDNSLNANPATQSILLTGLGTTVGTLLTLTIPDQTYGVAPFALNATSNSPAAIIYSVLSGPATISGNVLTITGTGHVTVQASQSAQTGYTGSVTRPGFTVNPAPLTVTANSTRRASGAANPTFTYTITGFVNGDTSSVVSGTATLTTVATSATPPGTYPITFSAEGLTAANYTFNYVNGSLIIGTQTIGLTPAVTANPATITIASSGGSGSTVLTVANFAGSSVTFTCTGLPAEASCNPGPLSSSNTATLQITTTAPSAALSMPPNRNGSAKTVYAVALPGLLAIGGLFATRRRQWRQLFVLLLLLSAGMAMTACGGSTNNTGTSGNPGNPSGPSDPGTPAATSTVTVTATDGAQTASVPITLVVQ